MTDADIQTSVAAVYLALAEMLDAAPSDRWDVPSLCDGWRVREVVAHVTMPARYREDAFMAELAADNFDFTRLSNRLASRDADLAADELVASLRDEVLHRWTPPGGGARGALNHAVIHSLDITVPLGEARLAPDPAMRTVLDDLTAGGVHEHFATDIAGRRLRATDMDWSFGSGRELTGAAEDLAAHLCGRTPPGGRLHGDALARLG
jgi:uncharacterized protein (TIGR03083 family)